MAAAKKSDALTSIKYYPEVLRALVINLPDAHSLDLPHNLGLS